MEDLHRRARTGDTDVYALSMPQCLPEINAKVSEPPRCIGRPQRFGNCSHGWSL